MNTQKGLHHRQAPIGLVKEGTCDLRVIHYGFASDENILRKYTTYKSHGQAGWALHRLVDERTLQLAPVKAEWFNEPPAPIDPNQVYRTPIITKLQEVQ